MPSLRLGNIAPDFEAQTTAGPIKFHDWIGDSWVYTVIFETWTTLFNSSYRPFSSRTQEISPRFAQLSLVKSHAVPLISPNATSKSLASRLMVLMSTRSGWKTSTPTVPKLDPQMYNSPSYVEFSGWPGNELNPDCPFTDCGPRAQNIGAVRHAWRTGCHQPWWKRSSLHRKLIWNTFPVTILSVLFSDPYCLCDWPKKDHSSYACVSCVDWAQLWWDSSVSIHLSEVD